MWIEVDADCATDWRQNYTDCPRATQIRTNSCFFQSRMLNSLFAVRFSESGRVCHWVANWRVSGEWYGLRTACVFIGKVVWATELKVETNGW